MTTGCTGLNQSLHELSSPRNLKLRRSVDSAGASISAKISFGQMTAQHLPATEERSEFANGLTQWMVTAPVFSQSNIKKILAMHIALDIRSMLSV